eukprot:m51a1_g4265 hypothetical protein (1044) ;mRNA; f:283014-288740
MRGAPSLAQLLLCCLTASAQAATRCANVSHDLSPDDNESEPEQVVMVVGQSAPFSGPHAQTGVDMRAGMEAAFALANETSPVKFALVSLDDANDDARQKLNVAQLLCTGANGMGPAFAIAGTVGSTASEAAFSAMTASVQAGEAPVPYVGALSGSQVLRTQSAVLQNSTTSSGSRRAGVVLARPGVRDEISAIVSLLATEWELLNSTSVFYEDTQFARDAVDFLSATLKTLSTSLLSKYTHATVTASGDLSTMATEAVRELYANGEPQALVLLAGAGMSGALLSEMASQNKMNVLFATISLVTAGELHAAAPQSAWDTLWGQSVLYMTQAVPMPVSEDSKYRIVSEYQSAMQRFRPGMNLSHASLEGFIAGRLVTTAASRALELYGWPLTRATFLDAIFRDIRTFKLYGSYTLGPYGDGVGSTGATQTSDDWCNQGAHQVFVTSMNMTDGSLMDEKGWSFKFSGCSVASWSTASRRAIVGYDNMYNSVDGDSFQTGMLAAISEHNGDNIKLMALTSTMGKNASTGIAELIDREAVAVTGLEESEMDLALQLIKDGQFLPFIAQSSGLQSLRRPFKRGVVNLFASYYHEARTAASFLIQKENAHLITVLWNTETHSEAGGDVTKGLRICDAKQLLGNLTALNVKIVEAPYSELDKAVSVATSAAKDGSAFIIVASPDDAWKLVQAIGTSNPILLSSAINANDMLYTMQTGGSNSTWTRLYRMSLTIPLSMLSSSNTLRQDFESWVSYDNQQQMQFEGFFVGKFLSAVLESMGESSPQEVTSDSLLDAIYATKYFKIDNKVTVGPFLDENSGERLCNQGMDTVYVTKLSQDVFTYVSFAVNDAGRCGKEFDPPDTTEDDNTERTVILSTTIPGFAVVCSLLIATIVVLQRRGRSTLKKIKRSELEIGERIGKGQFGTVHNGDWHGTPVAIRVIDKTAITREDLGAIKSEMALTHSLHHPNLMMMLGYSESKTDLLIVSEYMASGSLHEYLKKNKQNMNYYNQVAIAFVTDSVTADPFMQQLLELEATLYNQLFKVLCVKNMLHSL